MVFHWPWGLLALVSLPAILGLHYFRSRKEVRRIGGLHLWEFARQRPPVGARWDRLVRSGSLLFQLLAALVASLLLAGVDVPRETPGRHYAVIVDDSLSMSAGAPDSSAARARAALLAWAQGSDRFTLIAAGVRPRLLCEPFSGQVDLAAALAAWQPRSPACDLSAASALAAKFLAGDEKVLCFTDNVLAATAWSDVLELWGVGRGLANNAIVFADRMRLAPDRDRILLRMQRFADGPAEVEVLALIGGQVFHRETVSLPADRAVSMAFETGSVNEPIEIRLPDDPLPEDHVAVLAPVEVKPVRVACVGPERLVDFVRRATRAVHDTFYLDNPAEADLVFALGATAELAARHVCRLVEAASPAGARLAQGKELLVQHSDRMVSDLPLEGLLWAYRPGSIASASGSALIEHATEPLLAAFRPAFDTRVRGSGLRGRMRYDLNLIWERTNLFRHTAWPVLVQGMIERCRQDLPGLERTNYRVGETVRMNLEGKGAGELALLRNGAEFRKYAEPPELLADLAPGLYELARGGQAVARFAVNWLAGDESDLRGLSSRTADTTRLVPSVVRETETNRRLFFALASLLIALVGLSWFFQDISR